LADLISNDPSTGDPPEGIARKRMIRATHTHWVPGEDPDQCRPSDLELSSVVVTTGEDDPVYGTEQLYRDVDLEVFYFNDTVTPTHNCDREGPELLAGPFSGEYHQVTGATIEWAVPVDDSATGDSGEWRVVVVYNDNVLSGDEGQWVPLELEDLDENGTFEGSAPFVGTTRVTYVVQAVDGVGNVTWLLYQPMGDPGTAPPSCEADVDPASGVDFGIPCAIDVAMSGEPAVDLGVLIDDVPDPVSGYAPLSYTVTVHNDGPSEATDVVATITLPAGLTPAAMGGVGWTCGAVSNVVTCDMASLAADTTAPGITVTVITPAEGGLLTTTAAVAATELDTNAANDSAQADTTVTPVELLDLRVTKDDGGVTAEWDQPLTYTITVTNAGPADVVGASVTDVFPAELLGVTWNCMASLGTCSASGSGDISDTADLQAGGTLTYTATGTVANGTAGPLQNTAGVSAPSGYHDINTTNDCSSVSTPVSPPAGLIFQDGFESGDTSAWSSSVP
jgi:uncharacterized repeat protein (TIGR01451 family)